ncbi:unnamed protein product [Merluccius merluccius]
MADFESDLKEANWEGLREPASEGASEVRPGSGERGTRGPGGEGPGVRVEEDQHAGSMEQVRGSRPFCSLSQRGEAERGEAERERRACRVPTQTFSSSHTLQAAEEPGAHLLLGAPQPPSRDLEHGRPGQAFSLRQLGICEPAARRGFALCPKTGLSQPLSRYSRGPAPQTREPGSPDRTLVLWGRGARSGRSSCLSSRSNSALTLTDTEMDNKSDGEMADHLSRHQAPPPLPPAPPPHKQHPSITSLSRSSLANQRSPSPPPAADLAADLPAECSQLQDSWVLGSDAVLESRHFLFKTGTGSTAFFGTATPGYTMATGAVYSTPARAPPPKLALQGGLQVQEVSKTLLLEVHRPGRRGRRRPAVTHPLLLHRCFHIWAEGPDLGQTPHVLSSPVSVHSRRFLSEDLVVELKSTLCHRRSGALHPENSSIDAGPVAVGRRLAQALPPAVFWRSRITMETPSFLKFNISVQKNALIGVYGRKGLAPSHTQYDFVELLDGSRLIAKERRPTSDPVPVHQAGFIQHLDPGVWHLAFYNDGRTLEPVSYNTIVLDSVMECPHSCFGNGECVAGACHCFPGFMGPYCSRAACPVLCSGNGQYSRGRCQCYSGWKGTECDVQTSQCIDPQCGGRGVCVGGECVCNRGRKGNNCEQVDCMDPVCSGHGACHHGDCHCNPGWGGAVCEVLKTTCPEQCSNHGTFSTQTGSCVCDAKWTAVDCSVELCVVDCGAHGVCLSGSCHCEEGWTGPDCLQRDCHPRCIDHGVCREGKCDCHQGWTGEHCTIGRTLRDPEPSVSTDGCPGLCNNNGRCVLDQNVWHCVCQAGWRGLGCHVATETLCSDGKDNEGDGLVDCLDPDCCPQLACQSQPSCQGAPDPVVIAAQGQGSASSQPTSKSFYDRIRFLIGPGGSHVIPGNNPFNSSLVSVIRGQVVTGDGTPLIGVNVSFLRYPEYGHTLTREDGMFDLLTNGGASLTLSYRRSPFPSLQRTVWLPWKVFHVMETVVMKREENDIPSCYLTGLLWPLPLILTTPLSTLYKTSAEDSPIIPETQVLHEQVSIPGSELNLVFLSSRAAGYKPLLKVLLTQERLPFGLMKIHLMVAVMGRQFQKSFPAFPDLSYTFIWDKTDAYDQKVYGLAEAMVSVGYEYESCLDVVLWERRTAVLQGYELDASNIGGWTLDKHHVLDVQNGNHQSGGGGGGSVYSRDARPLDLTPKNKSLAVERSVRTTELERSGEENIRSGEENISGGVRLKRERFGVSGASPKRTADSSPVGGGGAAASLICRHRIHFICSLLDMLMAAASFKTRSIVRQEEEEEEEEEEAVAVAAGETAFT